MRKNIYYLLKANISNLIHNYAYPWVHYLYTDSFPSVRVNRTYTQELISHFLLYLPYIIRLLTAVRATALPLIMFKPLFWHRQIRWVYERRKKGIFTQKCVAFLLYAIVEELACWFYEKKKIQNIRNMKAGSVKIFLFSTYLLLNVRARIHMSA